MSQRGSWVIGSARAELDAIDAGWSYIVSKNLILKHRSDLFTAVQTSRGLSTRSGRSAESQSVNVKM